VHVQTNPLDTVRHGQCLPGCSLERRPPSVAPSSRISARGTDHCSRPGRINNRSRTTTTL
jgi:hypothetical protein